MSSTTEVPQLEARIAALEARVDAVEWQRARSAVPVRSVSPPPPPPPPPAPAVRVAPAPPEAKAEPVLSPPIRRSLADLAAGRVLAWAGASATLLGVLLFLALAASRGWLGHEARIVLAAGGCASLVGIGVWLHERRARVEAARAASAAGLAGGFATAAVAGAAYHLIPPVATVAAAALIGALAALLAVRWRGRALGILGLAGSQAAPLALGLDPSTVLVMMLGLMAAAGVAVASWRRWGWLAGSTVLLAAPEWVGWAVRDRPALPTLVVVGWFAAAGLAGAVGAGRRQERPVGAIVLAVLSASLAAAVGRMGLPELGAATWLLGLGVGHGVVASRRHDALRPALGVLGIVLCDVALALALDGVPLVAAWGASSIAFAWLIRRGDSDRALLGGGLGAHVALTLARAVLEAPPGGPMSLPAITALALLAGVCLAGGRILDGPVPAWARGADALGLATVAYLTYKTLAGPALVAAWSAEAVGLLALARRGDQPVARWGAAGFGALAAGHAVALEVPPTALLAGVPSLGGAALALGALVAALLAAARSEVRLRGPLLIAAAGGAMYLASVAIITGFQPSAGADPSLLELGVRQQGQVVLSALWAISGVAALLVGLRRDLPRLRLAALGWLSLTCAKVFLYDLSTLTSIYRVVSFVALGLLLLAAAFAWSRLRPEPLPDLRAVPAGER